MLDNPAYVSSVFLNNADMAPRGLETGASRPEMQNIGYWASGFLRFLRLDRGSDAFIFDLWTSVRKQLPGTSGYSDLRALIDTVGGGATLGSKWTTFANRFQSKTTGYSGWPMPPSDRAWYNASQASADIPTDLTPFSTRKLLFIFNTALASTNYAISTLSSSVNLNHALYKATDNAGPFTFLGNLRFGYPQSFTPALGDVYLVSITNTDTNAPYTAAEQTVVHIGPQESCAYCPDVPATAVYAMNVYSGIAYKSWRPYSGSSNYYASISYYDAAGTKPKDLVCNWPTTFNTRLHSTYYQSGGQEYLLPYDTNGSGHGTHYWYYENGVLWYAMQYNHGQRNGQWLINQGKRPAQLPGCLRQRQEKRDLRQVRQRRQPDPDLRLRRRPAANGADQRLLAGVRHAVSRPAGCPPRRGQAQVFQAASGGPRQPGYPRWPEPPTTGKAPLPLDRPRPLLYDIAFRFLCRVAGLREKLAPGDFLSFAMRFGLLTGPTFGRSRLALFFPRGGPSPLRAAKRSRCLPTNAFVSRRPSLDQPNASQRRVPPPWERQAPPPPPPALPHPPPPRSGWTPCLREG